MQNLKEQKPKLIDVSKLILNETNPRSINDFNFEKLKTSLKEFPKMLELRPIICNDEMIVLGGNMRLRAAIDLGFTKVPVLIATDLSEEQQKELIIKDNIAYGSWDWETLANEWDVDQLSDWGLNVPQLDAETDYSILDDADLSDQMNEMNKGIRKAIQIEFEIEHYEEASELVKWWREQGLYIGGFLMEKLKDEKNKIA